jgi:hypothetical protein
MIKNILFQIPSQGIFFFLPRPSGRGRFIQYIRLALAKKAPLISAKARKLLICNPRPEGRGNLFQIET